jgi:MFS family permease
MHWRWIFWILLILSSVLSVVAYFCLFETYAPMILEKRKKQLEQKDSNVSYKVEGASEQPVFQKIKSVPEPALLMFAWLLTLSQQNCSRALRILFTQPIVLIMSIYQAVIFSTMFTLYSTFTNVWTSPPYNFTKKQLALTYLAPATGFIIAAIVRHTHYCHSIAKFLLSVSDQLYLTDHSTQHHPRLPLPR